MSKSKNTQSKNLILIWSVCIIAILSACGDNGTESSNNDKDNILDPLGNLPSCNDEQEGVEIYIEKKDSTYICNDGSWIEAGSKDSEDQSDSEVASSDSKSSSSSKTQESCSSEDSSNSSDENSSNSEGVSSTSDGESADSKVSSSDAAEEESSSSEMSIPIITSKYDSENNTLTDLRDGHIYRTVTIAPLYSDYSEVWMAENLNYETGTSYCYNDSLEYCETLGRLYTWATAVGKSEDECGREHRCALPDKDIQGVCPDGWHIPSNNEFWDLTRAVGRDVAGKMLKSSSGWLEYKEDIPGDGEDAVGFTALPAGYRYNKGGYSHLTSHAYFWSSTEANDNHGHYLRLDFYPDSAAIYYYYKDEAYSVRCLMD